MIQGNSTWLAALAAKFKQPMYYIEIPDLNLVIASFSLTAPQQIPGTSHIVPTPPTFPYGYGTTLYGVGGYGQ